MPGFRNTLRDRAVTILLAADTLAGQSVFPGRVDRIPEDALPAVAVYATDERMETHGLIVDTPEFRATVSLEIEVHVGGKELTATETDLETLIDEVREGLMTSGDFVATPVLQIEAGAISPKISGEAGAYVGFALIRLDVVYVDEYAT